MNTVVNKGNKRQLQLTDQLTLSEIRMFIHDLCHLIQAIVGSVDSLKIALQEHTADLVEESLNRLVRNTDLAIYMLRHFAENPHVNEENDIVCNLDREINRVVDSLGPFIRQNGITINQKMLSPILAAISKADLCRLLSNILINAIEATNSLDAMITITTEEVSDEMVQISVQDNGCGIDKNKLTEIFREGYTTKMQRENKGMGLTIVKGILETYGGIVRVQSQPGKGARFMIRLPKAAKAAQQKLSPV